MAIATLKGLEFYFGTVGAELFNLNGFGFEQIRLHALFLSLPPARYTGKAGEEPGTPKGRRRERKINVNTAQQ
jgi:hypothetical protein